MSKRKYNLVCVAHPDDETIFFGGLIQKRNKLPWMAICVTDGNADGQGNMRRKQFQKACSLLGVEQSEWWAFPDIYEQRLPVDQLIEKLKALPTPTEVFTHGILGEYGHPHHQDVSFAVHQAFETHPKVYVPAYNSLPEFRVDLTAEQYDKKTRILTKVYGSETSRFLNLLPATFTEGFLQLEAAEVKALYDYLAHGQPLRPRQLKAHRWLTDYLKKKPKVDRPF